jgi:hypothetical protein
VKEAAPVSDAQFRSELPAMLQELIGDVGEDHLACLAHQRKGTKPDQAITTANIHHNVTRFDAAAKQDPIPNRSEGLVALSERLLVATVSTMQKPSGPLVGEFRGHRLQRTNNAPTP